MDKYERLRLMKLKIEALKEQRKEIDQEKIEIDVKPLSFVSHIAPQGQDVGKTEQTLVEKVSISIQTDDQEIESRNAINEDIITYEQGTQTEAIVAEILPVREKAITEELSPKQLDQAWESHPKEEEHPHQGKTTSDLFDRQPATIDDQGLSLNFQTFSLQESLLSSLEPSSKISEEHGALKLSHTLLPKLSMEDCKNFKYIWADVSEELLCTVLYFESRYTENSMVQVHHVPTGKVIDALIFKGQTLVRTKFVGNSSSKVTSMLLTSYTGKCILYELRSILLSNGNFKIERNILTTSYLQYPTYAIHLEYLSNCVLLANTSGQIIQLSTLDLKPSQGTSLKIVPQSRSDLISYDASVEDENQYYQHLLVTSLYDELSILCMLVLPSDLTSLYLGCEDGFIYKVSPLPLKSDDKGLVKIDIRNNGFIPEKNTLFNDLSLFHLGPVTGMQTCYEIHGVFFSYALDGLCHFWDTVKNRKIETIDCGSEIIFGKYFALGDKHYLGLLTPDRLQIFNINFLRSSDDSWQIEGPINSEFSIYCESTPLKRFSSFELVGDDSALHIALGGESPDFSGLFIHSLFL